MMAEVANVLPTPLLASFDDDDADSDVACRIPILGLLSDFDGLANALAESEVRAAAERKTKMDFMVIREYKVIVVCICYEEC